MQISAVKMLRKQTYFGFHYLCNDKLQFILRSEYEEISNYYVFMLI